MINSVTSDCAVIILAAKYALEMDPIWELIHGVLHVAYPTFEALACTINVSPSDNKSAHNSVISSSSYQVSKSAAS